jgi:hypothetical protein
MSRFGIRYIAIVGGVMAAFVNFVACGSQLYKVSMKDDTSPTTSADNQDPADPSFGLHAPDGWKELPIHFVVAQDISQAQLRGLTHAMNTWETAVGRKLFVFEGVEKGVTGDSFSDLYSSLNDGINGYYLDDNWEKTGKPQVVLATTIWDNEPTDAKAIRTADIRFNAKFYLIGDSFDLTPVDKREVVDMETLALHELGHMLGLSHMNPAIDSYSIMTPSLYIGEGLADRKLSRGDIERIQKIYGCKADSCDIDKTLAKIDTTSQVKAKPTAQVDTAH